MAADLRREAERQARIGVYNRRFARGARNTDRAFALAGYPLASVGEFLCTCGDDACDEVLVLTLEEYGFVEQEDYRFLVAPDHATDADETVLVTDEYEVVELKPEYRQIAAEIISAREARRNSV